MPARECYHCKQMVEKGEPHDCWTTTEEALTRELPDDLRDAWDRIRETATGFGDQRIYASHKSIMFSRKHCYFFVRPNKKFLEVWFFLGRTVAAPQVAKVMRSTPTSLKACHLVKVVHRDEVEAPITEWLREAYDVSPELSARPAVKKGAKAKPKAKPKSRAKAPKKTRREKRKARSSRRRVSR